MKNGNFYLITNIVCPRVAGVHTTWFVCSLLLDTNYVCLHMSLGLSGCCSLMDQPLQAVCFPCGWVLLFPGIIYVN